MANRSEPVFATDQEWLDYQAAQLGAHEDGFQVTDVGRANWCVAMKARAEAHLQTTAQQYDAIVAGWTKWREAQDAADQATIERMTILLRPYFDAEKAAGRLPYQRKSLTVPAGIFGERWHDVQFEPIPHTTELLPWAKAQKLVRTTEEPDWAAIKKQLRLSQDQLRAVIVHEVIDEQTGAVTEVEEEVRGVRVKSLPGDVFYIEGPKTPKGGEVNHA